jgi:tetratricopeptide (TPR) repeat protein
MREYERASDVIDVGLQRSPNDSRMGRAKAKLFALWKGDLDPMRKDVETRPANTPTPELSVLYKVELLLLERKFDEALTALRESNFSLCDGESAFFTRDMLQAEILTQADRGAEAKAAWERALPRLAQSVTTRPDDPRAHLAYAMALAGTGSNERAISEAKAAVKLRGLEKDAFDAPNYIYGLALIYARTGQTEEAKRQLEQLLTIPSLYSKALFLLSPAWDPVRN